MRQWMVKPKDMCNQHLLGEHVEHHMFVGTMAKEKSLDGYLKNNLLEPLSLHKRHNELVLEMINRGMNHKSPLVGINLKYLSEEDLNTKIDKESAAKDLFNRCEKCHDR